MGRDRSPTSHVIITPVDTPPVPVSVLDQLLLVSPPAVPTHDDTSGHPVVGIAAEIRTALQSGTLRDALAKACRVEVEWPDTIMGFNTPEAWESWLASRTPPRPDAAILPRRSDP